MDCLTTLPPEVLQRLLSKLDQATLIGVVTSVCKTLRSQALAVASTVTVELGHKAAADKFAAWVAKYGHTALASLEVLAPSKVHVQLPFSAAAPQLQHLRLAGGRFNQQSINFEAAVQLISLEATNITADSDLLHRVAVLTSLQSLALHNIDSGPLIDPASRQSVVAGAQLAWSNLTQLTALSCTQCDLSDAAVAGLTASLTKLESLDLSGNQIQQPAVLLPLPPALTFLDISNNHQHLDVSQLLAAAAAATQVEAAASSAHAGSSNTGMDTCNQGMGTCNQQQELLLQQLGGLQHLDVSGLVLSEPHLLTGLQSLTQLVAKRLKVDNPPLLLEALAPLSALRHLDLRGVFRKRPGSAAAPASLSLALTDKPHLSYLDLGQNRIYDLGAPAGLGAIYGTALMAPPWQLPVLQVLWLDCIPISRGTSDDFPQYRLRAHDLQQLPLSCPSLQQLDLRGRIHGGVTGKDLQPLLQLAGTLTSLSLGGGEFDLHRGGWAVSDSALSAICQLSRLESLTAVEAREVTDVGLLCLCKLRQLRELRVLQLPWSTEAVSEALAPMGRTEDREIKLSTKPNKAPNVWQQLLSRCNRSPACLRARQKELEQELAAAHKVAAKERKRAAAAEQEAAAAQGEVAALRQQLAELQAASDAGVGW